MLHEPFSDYDVYATLAAAEAGAVATGVPIKAIRCNTAGTLRVTKSGGVNVDLPFLAGETQYVTAHGIFAAGSTGCVPITVFR